MKGGRVVDGAGREERVGWKSSECISSMCEIAKKQI